jgi:hypothetical protein
VKYRVLPIIGWDIVQRILRGVETRLIRSVLVNWRPAQLFFLKLKGPPSQEEHKTMFSSLKINEMALSNQVDFLEFFHLCKMTYQNFINSGIWQFATAFALKMAFRLKVLENWLSGDDRLLKVYVCVTESIADCWKERSSITLSRQRQLISLKLWKWFLAPLVIMSHLKLTKKNGQASSLQSRIIWA